MQRFLILISLILSVVSTGRVAAGGCSRPLVIGWAEIPPVFFAGADGRPVGMDIDILRAVLNQADCRYETRYMPFKRYNEALKFGLVDIVMSASRSAERKEFAYFSHPYRHEQMVLFTTPSRLERTPIDSLAAFARTDMTAAKALGMWLGSEFEDLCNGDKTFEARILPIDGYPMMLNALMAGRVDAVIGDSNSIPYLTKQLGLEGRVVPSPIVVHDNNVYFMFSKKAVPLADMEHVNEALRQFIGTPAYMEILTRYPAAEASQLVPKAEE